MKPITPMKPMRPNAEGELLACPFCGGTRMKLDEFRDGDCYWQCQTCTTCGPNGHDAESATIQWNKRKPSDH